MNGDGKLIKLTNIMAKDTLGEIEYVHSGYESKYEQDLFLIFEDGVKVDEYFFDNTQS